jgi:hypothetical protein
MSIDFLRQIVTGSGPAADRRRRGQEGPPQAPRYRIDWLAARQAQRACCCPARPVVIVLIPPGDGRPHTTDLLLCGHHYRASRPALAAAGATVLSLDGRITDGIN